MKATKRILFSSLLFLLAGSLFAQDYTVRVSGKVKFIEEGFKMTAYQMVGTGQHVLAEAPVDSEGNYCMSITTAKPGVVTIDAGRWQAVNVWVQDEPMEIDFRGVDTAQIKIKNPPYVFIKSGPKNEVMNFINYVGYRNYQNMIAISQTMYRLQTEDTKSKDNATMELYGMNGDDFVAYMRYLVEYYADRPSVMAAIRSLNPGEDKELIDTALEQMIAANPEVGPVLASEYREEVRVNQEKTERMRAGNPAPLFALPDVSGKVHQLTDFQGKVTVLDFWASWCGPCRKSIPGMKKLYEAYGKDGRVNFVNISIDAKKEDWLKALNEEQMPWLQLQAPDGGKEIMEDYQFGGIPFVVVLDAEGKIYKKNVRGEAIEEAIKELLSGATTEEEEKESVAIPMGAMTM